MCGATKCEKLKALVFSFSFFFPFFFLLSLCVKFGSFKDSPIWVTLQIKSMVLKIKPDQLIRSGIDHSIGLISIKKTKLYF